MIKNLLCILLILLTLPSTSLADEGIAKLAKEMDLYAGTKASIQWQRIFSSERRLKRHNLDTLDKEKLVELKNYLIKHAADSKQPVVPGL